jgi:hypothetical protein
MTSSSTDYNSHRGPGYAPCGADPLGPGGDEGMTLNTYGTCLAVRSPSDGARRLRSVYARLRRFRAS